MCLDFDLALVLSTESFDLSLAYLLNGGMTAVTIKLGFEYQFLSANLF